MLIILGYGIWRFIIRKFRKNLSFVAKKTILPTPSSQKRTTITKIPKALPKPIIRKSPIIKKKKQSL